MASSFNLPNNHGIMDDQENEFDSISSSFSSFSNDSIEDSSSDVEDDANSSNSCSLSPSSSSSPTDHFSNNGPLYEMSSIMQQLPIKRGLSKHFQGKSQSFTSLANVKCLEDLAKPENPCNKRLKSCKSYGGLLAEAHKFSPPKACSRAMSKSKASKGSCPSLSGKRNNSFLGNKPPVPPQRPTTNQTPWFV